MHLSPSTRRLTAKALAKGFGTREYARDFAGKQSQVNAQLRTYYRQRGAAVRMQSFFRMLAGKRLVVLMRRRFRLAGVSSSLIYMRTCLLLNCRPNSKLLEHLHAQNCFNAGKIDFTHNFLGDRGLLCCLTVIRQSFKLRTLRLGSNGIRNQGVIALAMVLRRHPSVTEVDLSNNAISDTGARALLHMMRRNRKVLRLQLDGTVNSRLRLQLKEQATKNQLRKIERAKRSKEGKVKVAGDSMVRYEPGKDGENDSDDGGDAENGDDEDEDAELEAEQGRSAASEIGSIMSRSGAHGHPPCIFRGVLDKLWRRHAPATSDSSGGSVWAGVQWTPLDKQLMRSAKLRKAVGIWWITFVTPKDNGSQQGLSKPEFLLLYQGISRLLCGDDKDKANDGDDDLNDESSTADAAVVAADDEAFDPYDDEYEAEDVINELTAAADSVLQDKELYDGDDGQLFQDEETKAERERMEQEHARL
eukprot:g2308.t1